MHKNGSPNRAILAKLEQEVRDMHFARALHLARTVPGDQFAATLWATAPHPRPGEVDIDLHQLTDEELAFVAAWKGEHAAVPQ
jgi:hypothetical protein